MERILGSCIFLEDTYPTFFPRLLTNSSLGDSSVYYLHFLACLDLHHTVSDLLCASIQFLSLRRGRNKSLILRRFGFGHASCWICRRRSCYLDVQAQ